MSDAEVFYKNYWGKLLDILENFENDEDFKLSNPTKSNWYQIRFGTSHVWIELVSSIQKGEIQAQLRMRMMTMSLKNYPIKRNALNQKLIWI